MKIIYNNPYRQLGVYSTSPQKEVVANQSKMKAFLKVGRPVSFPLDLEGLLPNISRSEQSVAEATAKLTLATEQLKYAQFWFAKCTQIDEIACGKLTNGDIDGAIEIWKKKTTVSSLQNLIVCAIIKKQFSDAISYAETLYTSFATSFVQMVMGENALATSDNLSFDFLSALCEEYEPNLFIEYITIKKWKDYVGSKSIEPLVNKISSAIQIAKSSKGKSPNTRFNAGTKLMNETKTDLSQLKQYISPTDLQYQIIADKLGLEILQCGIDYYNDSEDDDAAHKAMKLQKYALSIVVGKMAKDRCKENVDILTKIIAELPPKEVMYYDKQIKIALAAYAIKPNKITHAIDLIKKCVPYLMSMKETLGQYNEYYLKTSTLIVGAALHNVIDEFNNVMNDSLKIELIIDRVNAIAKIKKVFDEAWKATLYMDKLDMGSDFRNGRYQQNRNSLREQVKDLINVYQSVTLDMRSETKIFNDCRTVADYNNYRKIFPGGKYASIIDERIEKCEFEACKTTQDCKAFKNKYPNTSLPISSKWEDCFYNNCRSIRDFEFYLETYPQGKYRFAAAERIDKLTYETCRTLPEYRQYLSKFPTGRYRDSAQRYINEEELWQKCTSSDSKELYKEYLAKYPNGRHKSEAEQKASACYIATMVYGDYNHPQVVTLRSFRDNTLRNSALGRAFIKFYYNNSPSWVEYMRDKKVINNIIKGILDKFINIYNYGKK